MEQILPSLEDRLKTGRRLVMKSRILAEMSRQLLREGQDRAPSAAKAVLRSKKLLGAPDGNRAQPGG